MKTVAGVAGLLLVLVSGGVVHADQTLTTELIKVSFEDALVCDAANVGPRAVDATITATFCEASLLASNFVCSHTATANAILPGTRAYCQIVVAGPASKVRATLRNETTGEKSDAR